MTGPVAPSDEELIAALADEYARWTAAPYEPDDWQRNNGDDLARANLLPVVLADRERYADQRAAEALSDAAEAIRKLADGPVPSICDAFDAVVILRARAAALTARGETGR